MSRFTQVRARHARLSAKESVTSTFEAGCPGALANCALSCSLNIRRNHILYLAYHREVGDNQSSIGAGWTDMGKQSAIPTKAERAAQVAAARKGCRMSGKRYRCAMNEC
jgi:hypothetical protein